SHAILSHALRSPCPHLSFFSRSPPHRDLPSFPTRRSSDLGQLRHRGRRLVQPVGAGAVRRLQGRCPGRLVRAVGRPDRAKRIKRSEEHTSELQSRFDLVCRLLLEKKKKNAI